MIMHDDDTLYQNKVEEIRNKLEKLALDDTYRMIQPTKDGVDKLLSKAEAARKLISEINNQFSHYKKSQSISMMLKKLEYTIKTATRKVEEIQEELLIKRENDTEATSTESSIEINLQEMPPRPRLN